MERTVLRGSEGQCRNWEQELGRSREWDTRETLNLTEIEEEIRAQANTGEKDEDKESQDWRRATTKDRTRDEEKGDGEKRASSNQSFIWMSLSQREKAALYILNPSKSANSKYPHESPKRFGINDVERRDGTWNAETENYKKSESTWSDCQKQTRRARREKISHVL